MCGLAGFSLSPTSEINARQLGHELLKQAEVRGTMASGFAYYDVDVRNIGYYKDAVRGGQLPLKQLPRDAKTAIFHTRQATQGTIYDNDNNHPIISPPGESQVVMTHNGVIWNDRDVRGGILNGLELADVDSAVIGPLIQYMGLEGLEELSGDVALAWLVKGESDLLHIARVESNPLTYTWLDDGSFVYASTARILMNALDSMDLDYGYVFEMDEGIAYEIRGGVIRNCLNTPALKAYDWGSRYSGWGSTDWKKDRDRTRAITQGATYYDDMPDDEDDEKWFRPGERKVGFANVYDEGKDTWEFREGGDGTFVPTSLEDEDEDSEEYSVEQFNRAMALLGTPKNRHEEYFTIDEGGDLHTYGSLDELESELIWWAGLKKGDDHFSHKDARTRWAEYFLDVGTFELDGVTRLSWIDQPDDIYNHEDAKAEGLGYVRDGVNLLLQEIGR